MTLSGPDRPYDPSDSEVHWREFMERRLTAVEADNDDLRLAHEGFGRRLDNSRRILLTLGTILAIAVLTVAYVVWVIIGQRAERRGDINRAICTALRYVPGYDDDSDIGKTFRCATFHLPAPRRVAHASTPPAATPSSTRVVRPQAGRSAAPVRTVRPGAPRPVTSTSRPRSATPPRTPSPSRSSSPRTSSTPTRSPTRVPSSPPATSRPAPSPSTRPPLLQLPCITLGGILDTCPSS